MKILLTNDDGIEANGLKALIKELSETAELIVIAPDREKSAVSHSLTFFDPLRLKKISTNGKEIYTTNGTPTDCIFLGLKHVLKENKPDLVISGINHGPNLGDDISYSGTVAGAIEATLQGIPSFAISLCRLGTDGNFSAAAKFAKNMAEQILKLKLPQRTLLNINVPDLPEEEIAGVAITSQGKSNYNIWIEESIDPRQRPLYWINSELPSGTTDENTDFKAIMDKKISITPVKLDFTDHSFLEDSKEIWEKTLNKRNIS